MEERKRNEKYAVIFLSVCIMVAVVTIVSAIITTTKNYDDDVKGNLAEYESLSIAYDELEYKYQEAYDKYIYYNHLYTSTESENNNTLEEDKLDEINQDISKAEDELASIKTEVEGIKETKAEEESKYVEEIKKLEQQLVSIKEKIDSNKNEPLTFYAGEYICGQDFTPGRYMIYDGSSNFFVTGGETRVNIILGDDPSWGQINEYVHFFTEGEKIEAKSPFKMKLVE